MDIYASRQLFSLEQFAGTDKWVSCVMYEIGNPNYECAPWINIISIDGDKCYFIPCYGDFDYGEGATLEDVRETLFDPKFQEVATLYSQDMLVFTWDKHQYIIRIDYPLNVVSTEELIEIECDANNQEW